jgi:inosine-uridine nucleoside N-ribohydrolase
VPVAAGRPPRNAPAIRGQYQYGLRPARKRPVREDAVEFLRRQLEASPGKLTIVTVGDLTNIGNLITRHPECKSQIKRIVIMGGAVRVGYRNQPPPEPEWNIKSDVRASQIVFSSGIPIVVAPLDATTMLKLEEPLRRDIFSADTPLTRQLATLYDLWNKPTPVLFDPVAVTLCFTERFCTMEPLRLEVDDRGLTREVKGQPNARVATAIRREEFLRWYVDRVVGHPIVVRLSADGTFRLDDQRLNGEQLARRLEQLARQRADVNVEIRTQHGVESEIGQSAVGLCRDAGIDRVAVSPNDGSPAFGNVTTPVPRRGMPSRVHVIENYETDIENRWWLAGRIETENVPRSLSASIPNHRTCRATMTRNFDGKMGDQSLTYKAVIFNPVPGPPMGPRTRLSFRYFLTGTDRVRVQIYSLTNGYHRYLTLAGLPQGQWQSATVDMTTARRPDGSGGPLAENERIDDIQFYIDPSGELLIDDIVLCDEADENEKRPFPSRFIFTGWFDTGRQGAEWPGDFEIVPHEKPLAWKAARSVINEKTGRPWIRVHLRGRRRVSEQTALSFRYKLTGTGDLRVVMANSETGQLFEAVLENPAVGRWTAADLIFRAPPKTGDSPVFVDEVRFLIDAGRQLLVDDILLYEPG